MELLPWFNPDNWMDVFDHLLLIGGMLAIAVIPSWFAARNHRVMKDVKDQVTNGHTRPLREDMDRMLSKLDTHTNEIAYISQSVENLRSELIDETMRRREGIKDVRDDVESARQENNQAHRTMQGDIDTRFNKINKRLDQDDK